MDEDLMAILVMLGVIVFIFGICIGIGYYSSCRQAQIFNQQNGTAYTCSDFFLASKQINQQTQTIKLQTK